MADKYCKNCGEKLPQDSKFCTNCGEKVDNSDKQSTHVQNVASKEKEDIRGVVQDTSKGKSPIKMIGIVALGLVIILLSLFLLLGSCEDTTTPDNNLPNDAIADNTEDSGSDSIENPTGTPDTTRLDDLVDSTSETNIDYELLRSNLGSYGTTLVYDGEGYTSVLKLQDHSENNFTLDLSTPHFVIKLDVITFTQDEILAIYDSDLVEVIYRGNRADSKEFSEGIIRYTDKESGSILNYEAKMYNNYEDFNTLANQYLGDFDFYYRDYYILEGSLSQDQENLLNSVIDIFYSNQTTFNIEENEQGNRDIVFYQNNENTATYLLNDVSDEILNGYLVESNIKGLQGELLSIHPLSHPDTNIYEGIIYWMLDDNTGLIIFFEGFQNKTNVLDNNFKEKPLDNNPSTISNFSGAWENDGELPIITVIDEGSITMDNVSEYNVSYSNKTVTNTQNGILLNNIADLALFKMPYTKNENGLNVSVNIYGGEEFFFNGDLNYYYILDSQGKAYESNGFNQPLTEISEVPSEIELVIQLEADYIIENEDQIRMKAKLTLYEDGVDDLHNPDPNYGDVYKITKNLKRTQ
ncbi:MAG: zinc-ribbon domain-containing protein [Clostridia bacterium]